MLGWITVICTHEENLNNFPFHALKLIAGDEGHGGEGKVGNEEGM